MKFRVPVDLENYANFVKLIPALHQSLVIIFYTNEI